MNSLGTVAWHGLMWVTIALLTLAALVMPSHVAFVDGLLVMMLVTRWLDHR